MQFVFELLEMKLKLFALFTGLSGLQVWTRVARGRIWSEMDRLRTEYLSRSQTTIAGLICMGSLSMSRARAEVVGGSRLR